MTELKRQIKEKFGSRNRMLRLQWRNRLVSPMLLPRFAARDASPKVQQFGNVFSIEVDRHHSVVNKGVHDDVWSRCGEGWILYFKFLQD